MAADECSAFALECEKISKVFSDNLKSSGNLSKVIKENLLKCLEDFKNLVKSQNQLIIRQEKEISNELKANINRHFEETKGLSQQIAEINKKLATKSYSEALNLNKAPNEKVNNNYFAIIRPKDETTKCKQTAHVAQNIVFTKTKSWRQKYQKYR
jgi:hypothetical protein